MTEFKEYDVVELIKPNPDVPEAEVGDSGTILMIFKNEEYSDVFTVECVLPDATNKWLGEFRSDQLKLIWRDGNRFKN